MSTPKSPECTFTNSPYNISKKTFVIAGIVCDVFGLSELPPETSSIASVWLLNPRLMPKESMEPLAHNIVGSWQSSQGTKASPGLIAVNFDQRNHGTRMVDERANQGWLQGNDLFAQDMFSIFHGTALDVSQLITYLPSYIFLGEERKIDTNIAIGVSLGGHCVWQCLLQEPRISAGISVIGCPDYQRLMTDRARSNKLETYTGTNPPGVSFLGSKSFPPALVDAVSLYDPAGLLMRGPQPENGPDLIGQRLMGKTILNMSGGADELVPYAMSKPFLDWLKDIVGMPDAPKDHNVVLYDKIFDGVGHEMSPDMVSEAITFIDKFLKAHPKYSSETSKI